MLQKTILTLLAGAVMLCGQTSSGAASINIFPPPPEAFQELKAYLSLSDAQLDQLRDILNQASAARQQVYQQIADKQNQLNTLLTSGSSDISRIGQLTVDIHTLQTQAPPSTDQWKQQALAVLTEAQRTKLVPLDQAIKLSSPAQQAVTFYLTDPPEPGRPIPLTSVRSSLAAPGCPMPLPMPLPTPQP